jgi:hypothetical protein
VDEREGEREGRRIKEEEEEYGHGPNRVRWLYASGARGWARGAGGRQGSVPGA